MPAAEIIASVSAAAALTASVVAIYVAYRQRQLTMTLAALERTYDQQQSAKGELRSCAAAAQIVSHRAMQLRRLVPLLTEQDSPAAPRIEERFDALVGAADDFIEQWARLSGGSKTAVDEACTGLAFQLNESVETVRLAWVARATGALMADLHLGGAVEDVVVAGQGCALALHAASTVVKSVAQR